MFKIWAEIVETFDLFLKAVMVYLMVQTSGFKPEMWKHKLSLW